MCWLRRRGGGEEPGRQRMAVGCRDESGRFTNRRECPNEELRNVRRCPVRGHPRRKVAYPHGPFFLGRRGGTADNMVMVLALAFLTPRAGRDRVKTPKFTELANPAHSYRVLGDPSLNIGGKRLHPPFNRVPVHFNKLNRGESWDLVFFEALFPVFVGAVPPLEPQWMVSAAETV